MVKFAVKWPFQFVVDVTGSDTNWLVLHSRVVSPDRQAQLAELKSAGYRFAGMSSDGLFPRADPSDAIDHAQLCEAWCHCFRNPDDYLPPTAPRALISASDFCDWTWVGSQAKIMPLPVSGPAPDFICVSAVESWKQEAKNWALARACLPRLCDELGFKGVVVNAPEGDAIAPQVTLLRNLPWPTLLGLLRSARFLFVPNGLDASPRVLTEALCLNVPIVVNRNILGGWKYVNDFTGAFFHDEDDVVAAVRRCLSAPKTPLQWFRANYGPYLAGRRLMQLLAGVDPSISRWPHVALANQIEPPRRLA